MSTAFFEGISSDSGYPHPNVGIGRSMAGLSVFSTHSLTCVPHVATAQLQPSCIHPVSVTWQATAADFALQMRKLLTDVLSDEICR